MNTILVPTDLSPASKNAAEYAGHLCKAWGAKMLLLNVIMIPVPAADIPYTLEGPDELRREFAKQLAVEADRLFAMFDIDIQHDTEIGIPDVDIVEFARAKDVGMIIMGLKHEDILDKILGGTINTVIRKISVPALIIPESSPFTGISSLVYATDLNYQVSISNFSPVKKISDTFGAPLQIIHVQKPGEILSQEDIEGKQKLHSAINGTNYQYITIENADINQAIRQFLNENPVSIFAMTAHKHHFLDRLFGKSHTKTLLSNANTPVLILQDQM